MLFQGNVSLHFSVSQQVLAHGAVQGAQSSSCEDCLDVVVVEGLKVIFYEVSRPLMLMVRFNVLLHLSVSAHGSCMPLLVSGVRCQTRAWGACAVGVSKWHHRGAGPVPRTLHPLPAFHSGDSGRSPWSTFGRLVVHGYTGLPQSVLKE